MEKKQSVQERAISLGEELALIPERLLLAHARGEVLFICGAGISMPAGLPDFRKLVLDVYEKLDPTTYEVMKLVPNGVCNQWHVDCRVLNESQAAEVRRFVLGDYDVVLGMLERRLDNQTRGDSQVRREVAERLRTKSPAPIHKALMRLSDRGGVGAIVTTNFDLLLEIAASRLRSPIETYSLGSIPRPSRQSEFAGVLHIHGAFDKNPSRISDLVLTDQDFGEFYLRRRVVPDFIHDAARLYNLVLVGYSANDAPMRYLLNAVAADGKRFDDLKERFTFVGNSVPDPVAIADWNSRGITPIHYDSKHNHSVLRKTLERWAALSATNGKQDLVDAELRRLVKVGRAEATYADRDLFDHFFRRSNSSERVRLSSLVSGVGASVDWLDAIIDVCSEFDRGRNS